MNEQDKQTIISIEKNISDLALLLEELEIKGQKNTYYIYNMWIAVNDTKQKLESLKQSFTLASVSSSIESN